MPHPDALPDHERAFIPVGKLREYVLNPHHDVGGHKARLFSSILGITAHDSAVLEVAILASLPAAPAVFRGRNAHGRLYQVDLALTGPKGGATVRTGWILKDSGDPPSLTTAIVLKGKT
ncbi:DUF6883 domain-containing protein [Sphaerotilus mobilis]|uniref:DUF6883 domain-containing protein n=1 Tax=Sphaerotilus mobilis TaxID=47994 RepID=A0A4Q7LG20_9BURK|nr:DUF6883 domain-containing protein [Sphaerotilus mobilis]RZS53012.1 hypothetical protein EV685_2635 [Sphaerotilus mobilis]